MKALVRFWRGTQGNATMEFVILLPLLTYFLMSLGEVGTYMARHVNLDRALDIAMRDVRLGHQSVASQAGLRDRICAETFFVSNCAGALLLELRAFGSVGNFDGSAPGAGVNCINRAEEITPVVQFDAASPGEIVFVRACLIVDPVFPGTGFLAQLPRGMGGGYAVVASSAFINEPG